ncbi:MAG: amino acid dehydrogenase [Alteromonadaceae bacterium]|nr:amino acid dehydrogenase [Alteromonadaceae bacterium]
MHIAVLGAGVVGTTTAWYLRQAGHEVTVLERQSGAGQETSFANGGQISVSHAEPWANPAAPRKILKWLFQDDAPLLFRLRADPRQWLWGLRFLRECSAARTRHNIIQIVNLGTYSRDRLQALRAETGIQYDQREQGILHFYTNPQEFEAALGPAELMREFGCQRDVISAREAVALEPALGCFESRIAGATFTRHDESGDAGMFTRNLAALAAEKGVDFRYGTTVLGLNRSGERIEGARIIEQGRHSVFKADAFVLSLGSYSEALARPLGVNLNIYPAKGYSITVPVDDESQAHEVSLTDDEYKLVYSRLGNRLRVAGMAELSGYSRDLSLHRCKAIVARASALFPKAGRWNEAEFWTGLRPATPSNVPYIGRSGLRNLYLNTGHGTLGWTHSCGSAAALADIVDGQTPAVDFAFSGK